MTIHTTHHHSIIHFLSWSQGPPSGTKDKQEAASITTKASTHHHHIVGRTNVVLHFDFFCPWSSYGPSSMPFWPPSSPLGTSCHRPPRSMTLSRPTLLPSKYKKFCRVYVCVVVTPFPSFLDSSTPCMYSHQPTLYTNTLVHNEHRIGKNATLDRVVKEWVRDTVSTWGKTVSPLKCDATPF